MVVSVGGVGGGDGAGGGAGGAVAGGECFDKGCCKDFKWWEGGTECDVMGGGRWWWVVMGCGWWEGGE